MTNYFNNYGQILFRAFSIKCAESTNLFSANRYKPNFRKKFHKFTKKCIFYFFVFEESKTKKINYTITFLASFLKMSNLFKKTGMQHTKMGFNTHKSDLIIQNCI